MVPVRKPGRPLSTCPHPPARGCGCGGVTAAIPRKQKCNCGSSNGAEAENAVKVESPTSDVLPTSPTKTNAAPGASYRIQKSTSKANGRKQSFGPAHLERMDASQVNILPAFDQSSISPSNVGMPILGTPTPRPSMDYGPMPLMGTNGALQSPMGYPLYQPITQMMVPPELQSPGVTTPMAMPQASETAVSSKPASKGGSCCGGSKSAKTTPPASTESSPKVDAKPKAGGCCSSKNPPALQINNLPGPSMTSANGIAMSPFQTPVALGPQAYPAYMPHPTLFTYPAHFGSYMSPLQPEQWKQAIEALHYGHPVPQPPGFEMAAPIAYSNGHTGTSGGSADGITSHMCTCGEACQCVGCAAHPYNQATQDYVRSAWESMGDDSYSHNNNGVNGANGANGVSGTTTPILHNGSGTAHVMMSAPSLEHEDTGDKTESPVAGGTPSEGTSGFHEELSASDFFFVTYPFGGDSCSGETASCPCGDECQCLGCSIHNNDPGPFSE